MEYNTILILRNLDMIYASLYDIFNQNFTCMGDKKFARIAYECTKISSEINKDFKVIIIVNKEKIEQLKLDPPFVNRFEKHIVNFKMMLNDKDFEISKKIRNYCKEISGVNNIQLKLNFEKLLINCKEHNIDELIFKIKNDLSLSLDNSNYEDIIIQKIFEKIIPTFCQDIIAYIRISNFDIKFHKMNEKVISIYQKNRFYDFESFLKNMKYNKNIIYTFSKITEDFLYNEQKEISNKLGKFDNQ